MDNEKEIKELEKTRWRSRKAIPIESGTLVATSLIFWIIAKFVSIPIWVAVVVLGLLALTLFGDIANFIYCNRKLNTLGKKREHSNF
jgi:hypothetical protein